MKLFSIICIIFASAFAENDDFEGYKLYNVSPQTLYQRKILAEAKANFAGVDFWDPPSEDSGGRILVPPEQQFPFTDTLEDAGIPYSVSLDELKSILQREEKLMKKNSLSSCNITFDCFPRLNNIYSYLEQLAAANKDKVKLVSGGKSFEGRDIKYLKISNSGFKDNAPIIFIDAGIHAREWIAHMTALFTIDKLVKNVTDDLQRNFDWIILPVVNPDGYEYSHTKNRFWRKTRSTGHDPSGKCVGVDGNRNFEYKWMTGGASSEPCCDVYAGPKPFSEPETRIIRDILETNKHRIKLFITIHSYGSKILYPWGHTFDPAPNQNELHRIGELASKAIATAAPLNAKGYAVHSSSNLYQNSGGSNVHAHSLGIPLNYVIELPRSRGVEYRLEGFILPPKEIKQIVYETWQGILVILKETAKLYS